MGVTNVGRCGGTLHLMWCQRWSDAPSVIDWRSIHGPENEGRFNILLAPSTQSKRTIWMMKIESRGRPLLKDISRMYPDRVCSDPWLEPHWPCVNSGDKAEDISVKLINLSSEDIWCLSDLTRRIRSDRSERETRRNDGWRSQSDLLVLCSRGGMFYNIPARCSAR